MNKKIAILTTIHPAYDARVFERTILPLFDIGYDVEVIAPWKPHPYYSNSIKWTETSYPANRIQRIFHGFKLFMLALKSQACIIHFHDIDFILWGLLIQIFSNKKLIYDCHENYSEEILYGKPWIPSRFRIAISRIVNYIEIFCVKRFSFNIVVVQNQFEKFRKITNNIELIRNLSIYLPKKFLNHEKNIIYIGSVSVNYGGNTIIELARKIKTSKNTTKIILFDKFDPEYKEKFLKIVKNENLPVVINPRFTRDEISNVMSRGCVGLSFSEDTVNNNLGLPTKLFEYMSFGIPVVASDIIRHQKILNISKSGVLVNHDDINQVYDCVTEIIYNDLYRAELQNNGYSAIENEFNWLNEQQKLINVYHKLLK